MSSGPRIFKRSEMTLVPAVTPTGTTSIARVINPSNSSHIGGGIEYIENATIEWTVTYDEILFICEGRLTLEFEGRQHECTAGDIVWLTEGTHLKYMARERAGFFYAVYPVDWAARQGIREP